jgi:hypothetical protein
MSRSFSSILSECADSVEALPHEEKRIVFLDSTSRESSSDLAGNSCNLRTTPKRLAVLNGWYRIVSLLLRN